MREIEQAGIIVIQQTWRFIGTGQGFSSEGFDGVRAEEKLTAFEQLPRAIRMYL